MQTSKSLAGLLVLTVPAFADDGDDNNDNGGYFFAVEARTLRPGGLPTDFTSVDPDDDGDPAGTIRSVEFSNEVSPRVALGWSRDDGSSVVLSWWDYDEDEAAAAIATDQARWWDSVYHGRSVDLHVQQHRRDHRSQRGHPRRE